MHLVIADKLLDQLNIKNPSLFYCGNLAPDAIMNRDNYVREMKRHTHFKDGVKQYEFREAKNQAVYLKKLYAFFDEFYKENDECKDLYLGYIVHILVDELYLLNYYEDFLIELERKKISFEDEEFGKAFVFDVDQVDWELAARYSFKYPMPEILRKEDGYEIAGFITSDELKKSKEYIISRNFINKHDRLPLKVTSFEKNYDFIELCVEKVPNLLKDRFNIV